MDTASNAEAEVNDSASSMSFNEFETFADEVSGDIPEVDCRGRVKSEKLQSDVDDTSISLSQASKCNFKFQSTLHTYVLKRSCLMNRK